jgi:hypothetical protein
MTMSALPIAIAAGDRRARVLIKMLLAHLERVRHQRWKALDFPEDRIQSRRAVPLIALEDAGRTTACEHISLEPLAAEDHHTDHLLAAVAPLERDPTLQVAGFHIDVAVPVGLSLKGLDLTRLAHGLRAWCARHLVALPEGASAHVVTVYGTPVRVHVEKTPCAGERGRLSIVPSQPPATFGVVVTERLHAQLDTLLAASADRHLLLFERNSRLWSAGQLRVELEASFDFPELSRVHEMWIADVTPSAVDEGPSFRRLLPV